MPPPSVRHPNRETPAAQATRLAVVVLLAASALLMAIVAVGGWSALAGQRAALAAYVLVYAVLATFVGRWKRGTLPIAGTLAIPLAIFAALAAPAWFVRHGSGYANPVLPNGLLGLLTTIIVLLQALLILFAARGFAQAWQVEIER